jgi:hypothetical protein
MVLLSYLITWTSCISAMEASELEIEGCMVFLKHPSKHNPASHLLHQWISSFCLPCFEHTTHLFWGFAFFPVVGIRSKKCRSVSLLGGGSSDWRPYTGRGTVEPCFSTRPCANESLNLVCLCFCCLGNNDISPLCYVLHWVASWIIWDTTSYFSFVQAGTVVASDSSEPLLASLRCNHKQPQTLIVLSLLYLQPHAYCLCGM